MVSDNISSFANVFAHRAIRGERCGNTNLKGLITCAECAIGKPPVKLWEEKGQTVRHIRFCPRRFHEQIVRVLPGKSNKKLL